MTYKLKPDPPESAGASSQGSSGNVDAQKKREKPPGRLVSLDAFRGFIMLWLAAEGFGLGGLAYLNQEIPAAGLMNQEWAEAISFHFRHPPWQSNFLPGETDPSVGNPWLHWKVSFWDLIQPAFMLMVGVAMPFSYLRREARGESKWKRAAHAFIRAVVLVLLGVFLYSLGYPSTNWIFPNVLAQIGLGYFFVYLLLGRSPVVQWGGVVAILVGTWIGIHVTPLPEGFEPEAVNASYERHEILAEPYAQWSKNGNAFHTFDVWFLNKFPRPNNEPFEFNRGGYQTLNFVPAMVTMLLGVLCGQWLVSSLPPKKVLSRLLIMALTCWALGVIAGATCCPIVKRIWTPAWVLFSGGYVIGMLALFYLLFDILPLKKLAFPLVVLGMNSIAVYLMGELLREWFVENVVRLHFGGMMDRGLAWIGEQTGLSEKLATEGSLTGGQIYEMMHSVVDPACAFIVIWLIAYYLYRQRIFFRI